MAELSLSGRPPVPPSSWAAVTARRELWLWAALAVAALAIAGVFALLLALSRIPGIETVFAWPVDFFHKGLVIHVVFSFVFWFLAVFAALASLASWDVVFERPRHAGLGAAAGAGMAVAAPLLFVPALLDRGAATLNNYVPVIVDPLYYFGLVLLFAAAAAVAVRLLANLRLEDAVAHPAIAAVATAAVALAVALCCLIIAGGLSIGSEVGHAFNEDLFWGAGHGLQFTNTALVIGAWVLLARAAPDARRPCRTVLLAALAILLLAVLALPWFYAVFPPFGAEQNQAFTTMQYAFAPASLLAAGAVLAALPRPFSWREPAVLCLMLSLLLFAVGGLLGFFVDGADTRTPAHYHGVIAAVTLAFMGLFYTFFLPRLGRAPVAAAWQRIQLHLFAWGQLLACVGLFVAGGHGAPRKVAGEAQGLEGIVPIVGLAMNGLGGLIAVVGGIVFVVLVLIAFGRRQHAGPAANI
jgi:hypothetical protein